MKQRLVTTFVFLVACSAISETFAQSKKLKKITFKTQVYMQDTMYKGFITNIDDTAIGLSKKAVRFSTSSYNQLSGAARSVPYDEIDKVQFRVKKAARKNAIIGGLAGMFAGVIAGLAMGDDKVVPPEQDFLGFANMFKMTAGEKAVGMGILGLATGTLVGGIIGAVSKKTFIIGRNKKNFEDMRQVVLNKAYMKINE